MDGWEVTAPTSLLAGQKEGFPYFHQEVVNRAVNEVGINRIRLEVRSGMENVDHNYQQLKNGQITEEGGWRPLRYATVNDNNDPHNLNAAGFDFTELDDAIDEAALPLRALLQARGERLWINVCYVAFTQQITTGTYIHGDAEEYAEFVLAAYLHMQQKYGFTPDTWEVILEPDNGIVQWSNGGVVGRAIAAAARRLRENGFTPHFVAPSVTDMGNAGRYFDELAAVPGAVAAMSELSYHRYGGATAANLAQIVQRAQANGLKTAMLEFWFGQATHQVLHDDLKNGRNSAWQGTLLQELFSINLADVQHPAITLREDTRFNLQYYRYIRAGAQRIGASSVADPFDPVAFINTNGTYVVVVEAGGAGDVSVAGLPAGDYRVSYAIAGRSEPASAPITVAPGGILRTTMPAAGVLTVFDSRLAPLVGD